MDKKSVSGRLTTQLLDAKVGDEINQLKPTGVALSINDVFPNGEKDNRRIVYIRSGSGITPFVSFTRHFHHVEDRREIVVLHGTSYMLMSEIP